MIYFDNHLLSRFVGIIGGEDSLMRATWIID